MQSFSNNWDEKLVVLLNSSKISQSIVKHHYPGDFILYEGPCVELFLRTQVLVLILYCIQTINSYNCGAIVRGWGKESFFNVSWVGRGEDNDQYSCQTTCYLQFGILYTPYWYCVHCMLLFSASKHWASYRSCIFPWLLYHSICSVNANFHF